MQVLTLKNKIVGTVPPGKPHESGGELCVKGRFCLSELVNRTEGCWNHNSGTQKVMDLFPGRLLSKRQGNDQGCRTGRSAVFISPGLTLEEIAYTGLFAERY